MFYRVHAWRPIRLQKSSNFYSGSVYWESFFFFLWATFFCTRANENVNVVRKNGGDAAERRHKVKLHINQIRISFRDNNQSEWNGRFHVARTYIYFVRGRLCRIRAGLGSFDSVSFFFYRIPRRQPEMLSLKFNWPFEFMAGHKARVSHFGCLSVPFVRQPCHRWKGHLHFTRRQHGVFSFICLMQKLLCRSIYSSFFILVDGWGWFLLSYFHFWS